jgi:hypothetical protein
VPFGGIILIDAQKRNPRLGGGVGDQNFSDLLSPLEEHDAEFCLSEWTAFREYHNPVVQAHRGPLRRPAPTGAQAFPTWSRPCPTTWHGSRRSETPGRPLQLKLTPAKFQRQLACGLWSRIILERRLAGRRGALRQIVDLHHADVLRFNQRHALLHDLRRTFICNTHAWCV